MLPGFPAVEKFRIDANDGYLKVAIARQSPVFGRIRKHIQHEGRSAAITRHGESKDPTQFEEASASFVIGRMLLAEFTIDELDRRLDDAANQIAQQFELNMQRTMERVTEKTGNVVDAAGRPFDDELFLETLNKMQLQFDDQGNWSPPEFWGGSQAVTAFSKLFSSPDFQRRLAELIERKRDEFFSREVGRVLAG